MNVYEEAHNLEQAIKESEEYRQMKAAQQKMEQNPKVKQMVEDFRQKQIAVQAKQMMGEQVAQEAMQAVSDLYAVVMQDPSAAEYLQCEMRFGVMMQDVYKILGDLMSFDQ
ncbi:MAG: YlbF family regulator [Eubacteriales bacterium]|jgi:cell fate (sporulation/competence/biofilm development) regulator YlbF (YheA/YmcA/DUF963 family)|nr:YlbF family regulator [Eubacteriales bacterium]